MRTTRLLALGVVCLLFPISVSTAGKAPQEHESLRAADEAWAAAAASNDVDRMMSFYDPSAVFINTNGSMITGQDNLRRLWTNFFSLPEYSLTWTLEGVGVSPDGTTGYTYGPWEQSYRSQDGEVRESTGAYLAVWKKQPDGTWKVAVDKP